MFAFTRYVLLLVTVIASIKFKLLVCVIVFISIFDGLLFRPPTTNDIPQYQEVQRILREEVVNPLRQHHYVRADKVMKLRRLLQKLSSTITGLTNEEKGDEKKTSCF